MRYRQSERRRRFFNESHSHRSVRTTPIYKDGGQAGYPAIYGGCHKFKHTQAKGGPEMDNVRIEDVLRLQDFGLERLDEDRAIVGFAARTEARIARWLDFAKGALLLLM